VQWCCKPPCVAILGDEDADAYERLRVECASGAVTVFAAWWHMWT